MPFYLENVFSFEQVKTYFLSLSFTASTAVSTTDTTGVSSRTVSTAQTTLDTTSGVGGASLGSEGGKLGMDSTTSASFVLDHHHPEDPSKGAPPNFHQPYYENLPYQMEVRHHTSQQVPNLCKCIM